jgi:hypothetical protein
VQLGKLSLVSDFEVASAGELRRRYGLTRENRADIRLNPADVPEGLRSLIGLAEQWGESDDLIREEIVQRATVAELRELVSAVAVEGDGLDEWLAGTVIDPTPAYIAFSCLRQAADLADVLLRRR